MTNSLGRAAGVLVIACLVSATTAAQAAQVSPTHTSDARATATRTHRDPSELAAIGANHELEHRHAEVEGRASAGKILPAPQLAVSSATPDVIGSWSAPRTNGSNVVGIHSVLLKTGKVLQWSAKPVLQSDGTYETYTFAIVWDPTTQTSRRVDLPDDGNVFCGASTILGDGTVAVVGGVDPYYANSSSGIPVVLLFDPMSETWTWAPSMRKGRWYPTITKAADGSAIIVGGRDAAKKPNFDVERITSDPNVAPTLIGQYNLDWQQGLYPNQFLMPDGRIFTYAGSRTDYLDLTNWTATVAPGPKPLAPQFDYPNAVVLSLTPGGPIDMVVYGGKNKFAGTNTTLSSRLRLGVSGQRFQAQTPMPQPRANMNSILLPDGKILVVGGNGQGNFNVPYLQSLMYDPTTDTWTPLASQQKRRGYHSTAMLLPNGKVLSSGDNGAGGGLTFNEIYSPPYLFRGTRPVITAFPTTTTVGTNIDVTTNVAVTTLVLMAPMSTTHATDMNQRRVVLRTSPLSSGGPGRSALIPNDGTVPPGPYMLFALNANGVPSVARWVQVN